MAISASRILEGVYKETIQYFLSQWPKMAAAQPCMRRHALQLVYLYELQGLIRLDACILKEWVDGVERNLCYNSRTQIPLPAPRLIRWRT
ncbi:hypothetical protein CEXT_611821 [Caerostris extrusa]|uniref:Uncharacterized protein n=1 Tax=Caerostris extrusa TaxID=172846 RepID=A0AAV4U171_CAEEX|nr:hypothetical protein CEXT_611821 [Caerostris extrusa]